MAVCSWNLLDAYSDGLLNDARGNGDEDLVTRQGDGAAGGGDYRFGNGLSGALLLRIRAATTAQGQVASQA